MARRCRWRAKADREVRSRRLMPVGRSGAILGDPFAPIRRIGDHQDRAHQEYQDNDFHPIPSVLYAPNPAALPMQQSVASLKSGHLSGVARNSMRSP
jgi:hypothetical protein